MRHKMKVRMASIRFLLFLAGMSLFMLVSLMVADAAIRHPTEATAFRSWMRSTWPSWLAWRLVLYTLTAWGIWKIRRAPGFCEAYRLPLLRISVASGLFIALCEYATFSGGGA
ncbi:hypothetical protein LU604_05300 [Erwinia tracheiphila]|uniref:Uncharacterized protein n=2 Tax=Erwinia tracheiphila TaxID=65700 RepID=A0A345CTZ5_9GAMM|nr:hypothetical protein [Erwinia tracheiphila]AXF76912.1 hypothetical protein AV903_14025 [Erwinia tracheiphila]UIA85615.1 hypothetical protein LU604_05300 [Erwinia tracheiphila]UIA94149.1 hypothetical protein LU632_05225 [Erwinia tracheiphila]